MALKTSMNDKHVFHSKITVTKINKANEFLLEKRILNTNR